MATQCPPSNKLDNLYAKFGRNLTSENILAVPHKTCNSSRSLNVQPEYDRVRETGQVKTKHNDGSPSNGLRKPWKIVVLGNAGVGKSSVIKQFLHKTFTTAYKPTVEDSYLHTIKLSDGCSQCIEILDTSGSYEFPAMKELHIRCSAACLLLFDLNNTNSLNSLIDLYATIERIKGNSSWQIVLVGNKCDIPADEKTRKVSKEASLLAENSFKCPYYESSAKTNINIDILFQSLVENINEQAKLEMRLLRTASFASSHRDNSGQRRNTLTLARRFSLLIPKSNQIRRFSAPIASNSNEKLSQISTKPKTNIRSKTTKLHKNCLLS